MFARRLCAVGVGVAILTLSGCGDFFFKDGSNNGGGTTVGSYIYVGTQGGVLNGYAVSSGGVLAGINSSQQLSTAAINCLAITPGNGAMYAGVAGTGVFGLAINASSGAATLLNNNNVLATDVAPVAMTIDPTGAYLLVAGLATGTPSVGEYAINTDGTLTEAGGSPVAITLPTGANPNAVTISGIAVAPNSSYIFVALGQLGVAAIPFNTAGGITTTPANGVSTTGGVIIIPKATSGVANQDLALAVNSGSTALFVGETNAGVRVFTIGASNSFTEIAGSPFAAGSQPHAMTFDGTGDYLYVANAGDNTISGYSVLASGTLSALGGSPYASVGAQPVALTLDQSKKYLLAANVGAGSTTPDVQLFSFDATTAGKLDPGATITNASQAQVIVSTR